MNKLDKLEDAISKLDDRFLLEVFEYHPKRKKQKAVRALVAVAACICFIAGVVLWEHKNTNSSILVYAHEMNEPLTEEKSVLMSGKIDDSGQMQGHPLQFYVLGEEIESIRFSCKNQWISFVDWTEKRGDYGLGKNFTVPYGENKEDYYYLVVNWEPQNIIKTLTEHENIKISDLTQKEKDDLIVMEIKYLDGRTETEAIKIKLQDDGNFTASVIPYQITEQDTFVFQEDSFSILHQP